MLSLLQMIVDNDRGAFAKERRCIRVGLSNMTASPIWCTPCGRQARGTGREVRHYYYYYYYY